MIRINRLQQRMPHLLPKMHSLITQQTKQNQIIHSPKLNGVDCAADATLIESTQLQCFQTDALAYMLVVGLCSPCMIYA
jgi:RNA-binding protein YlmH